MAVVGLRLTNDELVAIRELAHQMAMPCDRVLESLREYLNALYPESRLGTAFYNYGTVTFQRMRDTLDMMLQFLNERALRSANLGVGGGGAAGAGTGGGGTGGRGGADGVGNDGMATVDGEAPGGGVEGQGQGATPQQAILSGVQWPYPTDLLAMADIPRDSSWDRGTAWAGQLDLNAWNSFLPRQ